MLKRGPWLAALVAVLSPVAPSAQEVARDRDEAATVNPPPSSGCTLALALRLGAGTVGGQLAPGRSGSDHLARALGITGDIGVRCSRYVATAFQQVYFGIPSASTGVDFAAVGAGGLRLAVELREDERWIPWLAGGVAIVGASAERNEGGNSIQTWSSKGLGVVADAGIDHAIGNRFAAGLVFSTTFAWLRTEYAYDARGEQTGSTGIHSSYRLFSLAARVRY